MPGAVIVTVSPSMLTPSLDELFEALTLIQTERIRRFPVVLFGTRYWQGLADWMRAQVLAAGCISPEDLGLFRTTDSEDEAVQIILRNNVAAFL